MRKDGSHRAAPKMIVRKRAVRDSTVDDGNSGASATRFTEKTRPEFGFGDEDHSGLNGTESATAGESVVEREIESAVGSELRFGQGLTGFGGGADKDATSGEAAS